MQREPGSPLAAVEFLDVSAKLVRRHYLRRQAIYFYLDVQQCLWIVPIDRPAAADRTGDDVYARHNRRFALQRAAWMGRFRRLYPGERIDQLLAELAVAGVDEAATGTCNKHPSQHAPPIYRRCSLVGQ